MQHLLDSGHGPIVDVPYYGRKYQGDAFLDYPRSQGWDTDWLVRSNWLSHGKSAGETHAFLQAWLFFGLLESVMGIKLDHVSLASTHD